MRLAITGQATGAIARLFEYGEVSDAQRIWDICICRRHDSVCFGDIVGSRLDTKLRRNRQVRIVGFNLDDYEPVASRLDRFLKAHPDARVITDLVHYLADVAVFKCELWLNDEIISTGWAEEVRGQGNVNKTSHLENCETGAVGRALANAGLSGSDFTKRPSREEMQKVVRYEGDMKITESANAPSEKQLWKYKSELKKAGLLPPLNIATMSKYEISKAIEALVNGEVPAEPVEAEEPF